LKLASPIDLHLHSTASDGRLAPRELVALLAQRGVKVFALTDHDTVAGLPEAAAAAREHGLHLLCGTELSAEWLGRTIHVVGLGIDPDHAVLQAMLERLAGCRAARASLIAARLDRAGAPGAAALEHALQAVGRAAPAQSPTNTSAAVPAAPISAAASADPAALARVTRTHLARALVELDAAPNLDSAFTRWLGQRGRAHVPAGWPPLVEVTAAIVAAGGAPVLAHPLRYTLSSGQRRRLTQEFKAAGGAALEVVVGGHAATQVEAATGLALRSGLAGSIGSDFHDPAFPWNLPGRLAKLPEAVAPVWARWAAVQEALGA
jgi:predicted metal-dependent phosphoesterase TrpH